jgi:hypothetical protein
MAFYDLTEQRDKYYKEKIEPLPQYCIFSNDPKKVDWAAVDPSFTWAGLDASMDEGFGRITAYVKARAPDFWEEAERKYPQLKPFAETQRLLALYPNKPLKNLLSNASFEEPPDPGKKDEVAKDWKVYHNRMVNATVFLDNTVKRSGAMSLSAKGLTDYSGVIRPVTVKNGARYRLSFWYRTTRETRHGALAIMRPSPIREHFEPADEWIKYEKVFTVNLPGKAEKATFTILLTLRHGGSEKSQIWFDDVRLEMLSPEGVEQ